MRSALYFYEGITVDEFPTDGVHLVQEKGEMVNFGSIESGVDYLAMEVKFPNRKNRQNVLFRLSAPITKNSAFIKKGEQFDFYFQYHGKPDEHRKKNLWKIQHGDIIIVNEIQMSDFLIAWKSSTLGAAWLTLVLGITLFLTGLILYQCDLNKEKLIFK